MFVVLYNNGISNNISFSKLWYQLKLSIVFHPIIYFYDTVLPAQNHLENFIMRIETTTASTKWNRECILMASLSIKWIAYESIEFSISHY